MRLVAYRWLMLIVSNYNSIENYIVASLKEMNALRHFHCHQKFKFSEKIEEKKNCGQSRLVKIRQKINCPLK